MYHDRNQRIGLRPPDGGRSTDFRRVAERAASDPVGGRSRFLLRLLLLITASLLAALPAAGQFSVQPVILEVRADSAHESSILVNNHSDEPLQVTFYAGDFDQDDTGAHSFGELGTHPNSCAERIRIFPDGAIVPPRGEQVMRIQVEPGAELCWSVAFVETAKRDAQGLLIGQRIGVKVYGIPSAATRGGGIEDVVAGAQGDSLRIAFTFRNTGSAPLRPAGDVQVRSLRGETVATLPIESFSVLPGHVRVVRTSAPLPESAGRFVVVPVLDFGGDYLAGGQGMLELSP